MTISKNLTIFLGFIMFLAVRPPSPKFPKTWHRPPGEQVNYRGYQAPWAIRIFRKLLPSVELIDAMSLSNVDFSKERGSVLLLSIAPSLDAPVCEKQTCYLRERDGMLR